MNNYISCEIENQLGQPVANAIVEPPRIIQITISGIDGGINILTEIPDVAEVKVTHSDYPLSQEKQVTGTKGDYVEAIVTLPKEAM
ncbi:MAG: hypothetical protein KZQ81_17490 [Candidatus Thiodiazotropha sp. (ex Rostrolucina anterorostrata)]|nr:hypothetical protein [Candidatus Thiodiazotropha sp. (ex Rostrolucina anterorostrata)]